MKMQPEMFNKLREAIQTVLDKNPGIAAKYVAGDFPRADRCKDRNVRFRWDLFWASGLSSELCGSGLNDAHIDTALRSIVPNIVQ